MGLDEIIDKLVDKFLDMMRFEKVVELEFVKKLGRRAHGALRALAL